MNRILLFVFLIAYILLPTIAHAQSPCGNGISGWNCTSIFTKNGSYSGNNAASGSNAATPSTAECPSGAGTLTPAHNIISCTLSGNVTLGVPSTFTSYTPYKIFFTENSTGGYTVTPPSSGYYINSNWLNGNSLAISTAPNTTSIVTLGAVTIGVTNEVIVESVGGPNPAYSPSIAITANGVNSTQCSGSGVPSCAGPSLTVTTGEFLAVESFVCGASCGSTPPTISSVTGSGSATLGTCVEFTLAGTKSTGNFADDAYLCPVTAGGLITPTVTYSATGYYGFVWAQAVQGAVGDDGIGNAVANSGGGTSVSITTNGSTTRTTGTGDLCISEIETSGVTTLTLNENVLNYAPASNTNTGTQYQNAGTTLGTVTATGSYASSTSYATLIVCLK